jgi:hypothetical protein
VTLGNLLLGLATTTITGWYAEPLLWGMVAFPAELRATGSA